MDKPHKAAFEYALKAVEIDKLIALNVFKALKKAMESK